MRIEKLEDGYRMTDLYIAAAVLCEPGMELVGVVPVDLPVNGQLKQRIMFVIKGNTAKIKEIIDAFFNCKHMVNANSYKTKFAYN